MPPKKQEEVDLSTLPPWTSIITSIRFECAKSRAEKLIQLLNSQLKSFQKNITRDDLIQIAKDKGFYVDPNALTDKQKKDPKAMADIATELNGTVLAKALNALVNEVNLNARKAKKEQIDAKNNPQPVQPAKKETKKDAKKDSKQQQVEPQQVAEEEKVPEKEYQKNFDQLFLLFDYPQDGEETLDIFNNQQNISSIFSVKEKVINWGGVDMGLLEQPEDVEGDLKERMEEFGEEEEVEEGGEEGEEQKEEEEGQKAVVRDFSPRSKEFMKQEWDVIESIKKKRFSCERTSVFRNLVVKDVVLEMDLEVEEETLKQFSEQIIEEICQFSLDQQQFQEWVQSKKTQPLITKEAPKDPFDLEIEKIKEEAARQEQERVEKEQQALQEQEKVKGKGGKKEAKKSEEELQKERLAEEERKKEEEARAMQIQQALEQQQKLKEKMHMQYYRKQLSGVELNKVGCGIILEVMLDQLEAEKVQLESGSMPISIADKEDNQRVEDILSSLDQVVSGALPTSVLATLDSLHFNREQSQGSRTTPFKTIIDEVDEIERRAHNCLLNDQQHIPAREKSILDNMCFPGIDRFQMPEIPEKSEQLRKADQAKVMPFITVDPYEFERRQVILKFEETMKENEPEHDWFFGDRVYLERHNRNTLVQTLYQCLLFDPHVISKYNDRDDSLQLMLYYKNPPGRILRRKWSTEWKVLPNLENWINFFKLLENNLRNDFFYDIDYQTIGNLHERAKILYPTDNSLILALKYQVGEEEFLRYKIIKESIIFGLQNDVFWANFDACGGIRLTVQLMANPEKPEQEEEEEQDEMQQKEKYHHSNYKAIFNLSTPSGLMLRFMPNGDVVQKYIEQPTFVRDSNQSMLHLYDNAEMNHDKEIRRVITGQASVIKYMKDGSIIVLYANGNVSMQQRNDTWITTNNKGMRKATRQKESWTMDSIPCAIKTDPESGATVYIRDDETMVIKYTDGSQFTKHADGTRMLVSASQDSVVVEHDAFSTVKVSLDRVKARTDTIIGMGSAYANVGFENIFERSNDGRVIETWVSGGRVIAYREKQELPGYKHYKINTIHLFYTSDGGVVKLVDDGEIVLITGPERVALNQRGENLEEGKDIDYWLQLFSVPDERRSGVFTTNLEEKYIFTRDEESNYFQISSTGEVVSKISVSLQQDERPQTPEIGDGDFIEEENKFLPAPKNWIPPRLLVINNDNTGEEYLNDEQLKNYFRLKKQDENCVQIVDESVPGIPNCKSLSFLTLVCEQKKVSLIKAYIPQTLDIIPKTVKKNNIPMSKTYLFRNLLQFSVFDQEQRAKHQQDLEKFDIWKQSVARTQSEFGIIQKSEEEKDAEFNIQLKILEMRKNDYSTETYDQCKNKYYDKLQQQTDQNIELLHEQEAAAGAQQTQSRKSQHGESVQNALMDMQKKADTKKIVHQIKQEQKEEQKLLIGFAKHYFETSQGIDAMKLMPKEAFEIPPKARQKIMSEEEYHRTMSNQTRTVQQPVEEELEQPPQDEAIISLENPVNQRSQQQTGLPKTIHITPSIFAIQDQRDEQVEHKRLEDALKYRSQKRKDYNLYGQERMQLKKVPCLLKTNPKSELNQKYILTDSITDNRMKISSMATRVYQQAPSISDLRNEGMHQTIIKTLDKKNQLDELVDKKNLMITGDLNDNLRKDISIIPIAARFGTLKEGSVYHMAIQVKNEDILAQRIVLKQPRQKGIKVFMKQLGPISLGLVRQVIVEVDAKQESLMGSVSDEFQIVSKHQIYSIPISGLVMESSEFQRVNQEYKKTHKKTIMKPYVKEIKIDPYKSKKDTHQDQSQEDNE